MTAENVPDWINGLLQPNAYPHATGTLYLIETHISWVVLTGPYAYKVKKPVNLGFLDFSTLDQRHLYCLEELRLNRRLAPEIYLDVLPITGSPWQPRIGGPGPAFDYAVRMRQFAQDALFSEHANMGRLDAACIDSLAEAIAAFHKDAPAAPSDTAWGTLDTVTHAVDENFRFLAEAARGTSERDELVRVEQWTWNEAARLSALLAERKADGFVRECHGDLHLGNLASIDGRAVAFDCIEFNPALRWIDLVSEVAFLTMDLEAHGLRSLAYRFINRYDAIIGDYTGLRLWTFYRCYRAMVRAKVARMTPAGAPATRSAADYRRYLDVGLQLIEPQRPSLVITHGLSGSGKSTIAAQLAERLGAIHLRSDVERKRLFDCEVGADTRSAPGTRFYEPEVTRATYARLQGLAASLLQAGLSVIVDAAFLHQWQRDGQHELSRALGVPLRILDIDTPLALIRERIATRLGERRDPSDADLAVLDSQLRTRDLLTDHERSEAIQVDGQAPDIDRLVSTLSPGLHEPRRER